MFVRRVEIGLAQGEVEDLQPWAFSRFASAPIARVADGSINPARSASVKGMTVPLSRIYPNKRFNGIRDQPIHRNLSGPSRFSRIAAEAHFADLQYPSQLPRSDLHAARYGMISYAIRVIHDGCFATVFVISERGRDPGRRVLLVSQESRMPA